MIDSDAILKAAATAITVKHVAQSEMAEKVIGDCLGPIAALAFRWGFNFRNTQVAELSEQITSMKKELENGN